MTHAPFERARKHSGPATVPVGLTTAVRRGLFGPAPDETTPGRPERGRRTVPFCPSVSYPGCRCNAALAACARTAVPSGGETAAPAQSSVAFWVQGYALAVGTGSPRQARANMGKRRAVRCRIPPDFDSGLSQRGPRPWDACWRPFSSQPNGTRPEQRTERERWRDATAAFSLEKSLRRTSRGVGKFTVTSFFGCGAGALHDPPSTLFFRLSAAAQPVC